MFNPFNKITKIVGRAALKVVRAVLDDITSQVTQQVLRVDDEVKNVMRGWVNEVISDMWEGNGADAFVNSINEEAIPLTTEVIDTVTKINDSIGRATDIIDQADNVAARLAEDVIDIFEAI